MSEATPARMVQEPESFGSRLKREREARSISLDDVSIATKISLRMLRALEEENFNQLPGGIFNKGFVRAYARHLGIDEDQAIAHYLEAVGETTPAQTLEPAPENLAPPPKPPKPPHAAEVPWGLLAVILLAAAIGLSLWSYYTRENSHARQMPELAPASDQPVPAQSAAPQSASSQPAPAGSIASQPVSAQTASEPAPKQAAPGPATPAAASPEAVGAQAQRSQAASLPSVPANPAPNSGSNAHPPSSAPGFAPTQTTPAQAAPTPIPNSPATQASALGNTVRNSGLLSPDVKAPNTPKLAPPPAATFVLLIEAEDNSWVSITADGKSVLDGTLIAPAVKSIRAEKQIVVKAGNVGALSFSVNGKKLPPQGEGGEVKTLTFSPNGLETAAPKPPS